VTIAGLLPAGFTHHLVVDITGEQPTVSLLISS
jgi:hypothetical protein